MPACLGLAFFLIDVSNQTGLPTTLDSEADLDSSATRERGGDLRPRNRLG